MYNPGRTSNIFKIGQLASIALFTIFDDVLGNRTMYTKCERGFCERIILKAFLLKTVNYT